MKSITSWEGEGLGGCRSEGWEGAEVRGGRVQK